MHHDKFLVCDKECNTKTKHFIDIRKTIQKSNIFFQYNFRKRILKYFKGFNDADTNYLISS